MCFESFIFISPPLGSIHSLSILEDIPIERVWWLMWLIKKPSLHTLKSMINIIILIMFFLGKKGAFHYAYHATITRKPNNFQWVQLTDSFHTFAYLIDDGETQKIHCDYGPSSVFIRNARISFIALIHRKNAWIVSTCGSDDESNTNGECKRNWKCYCG